MDEREVVRCAACAMVQFRTKNNFCRRCTNILPQRETLTIPPLPLVPLAPILRETNATDLAKLGERIRQLRTERAFTQIELARKTRMSRAHLLHIEQGSRLPSIAMLEKLSAGIEIPIGKFFSEIENDWFIQKVLALLPRINQENRLSILRTLKAITPPA